MLKRRFQGQKVEWLSVNIDEMVRHYDTESALELYFRIAKGSIDLKKMKGFVVENGRIKFDRETIIQQSSENKIVTTAPAKGETLLIGDEKQKVDFSLASCCSPIPGDEVFGFITVSDGIKIHRTNCSNAQELMSKYAYRVIKARWSNKELVQFEVGLKFAGIDDVGLVQKITNIISTDMNVNMKAISFEANNGIFQGKVVVLVHDTNHLGTLIDQLKAVEGVLTVDRIESEFA
jgi:GTP pyrophosphokinase